MNLTEELVQLANYIQEAEEYESGVEKPIQFYA